MRLTPPGQSEQKGQQPTESLDWGESQSWTRWGGGGTYTYTHTYRYLSTHGVNGVVPLFSDFSASQRVGLDGPPSLYLIYGVPELTVAHLAERLARLLVVRKHQ